VPQKFFAALLLVACDVPAARKLCGFLGHGAKRGCSKCKKEFISGEHFGDKNDLKIAFTVQMRNTALKPKKFYLRTHTRDVRTKKPNMVHAIQS